MNMVLRSSILASCMVFVGTTGASAQEQTQTSQSIVRDGFSCSEDPKRIELLTALAELLNDSVPEYRQYMKEGFRVLSGNSAGFIVWDLTNPENHQSGSTCVAILEGHVYHVVPRDYWISFSHVVFIKNGKLMSFRSVNCKDRGETIGDAIKYAETFFAQSPDRDEIVARIRNYRSYGQFRWFHDDDMLRCEEVSDNKQ